MTDYEYFAKVGPGRTEERPRSLWRRAEGQLEFLSLLDWSWHPVGGEVLAPRPDVLVPISPEQAERLLGDRQRFVEYWVEPATERRRALVYRRRRSPELVADEIFGRDDAWVRTHAVREFLSGQTLEIDLVEADQATVERIIEETRGISGATEL